MSAAVVWLLVASALVAILLAGLAGALQILIGTYRLTDVPRLPPAAHAAALRRRRS